MSSFTTPLAYEPTGEYYDGNPTYRITEAFTYFLGDIDHPIAVFTVPVGFITDFASIPYPFNLWFKPTGQWAKAAALHDWVCNNLDISHEIQDSIFLEAMEVLDVNKFIAHLFFMCVRIYRG